MPTYYGYLSTVIAERSTHDTWRHGQTAFNVLYRLRPDLSEQVRATPLDPFHCLDDDPRIDRFYEWVATNW